MPMRFKDVHAVKDSWNGLSAACGGEGLPDLVALSAALVVANAQIKETGEVGASPLALLEDVRKKLAAYLGQERAIPGTPEANGYEEELVAIAARFASPVQVEGYDTVLGYLSRVNPEAIYLMYDPIDDTKLDGFWLTKRVNMGGLTKVQVPAPECLRERGITGLNAYPIDLLRERLGE